MEVILNIESNTRFILSVEEALQIAEILCACQKIDTTWKTRAMDYVAPPNHKAAFITPYTAIQRLDHETNAKEMKESK
jgi:hypothetical protein